MTNSYDIINNIRINKGHAKLALIDPDLKNDSILNNIINIINESDFDELYLSIYDLLINPDKRKLLGIEAQKRAKQEFDWGVVAKKYLEIGDYA